MFLTSDLLLHFLLLMEIIPIQCHFQGLLITNFHLVSLKMYENQYAKLIFQAALLFVLNLFIFIFEIFFFNLYNYIIFYLNHQFN